MIKKAKNITLIIICSIILAFTAGYYLYNKGPADVSSSSGKSVDAIELYKIFINDSVAAKNRYTGKTVEVTGTVAEVFKNQQGQSVILLKTGITNAFINCTMEGPFNNIKSGDKKMLKGICNGIGETDTILDIFGDVYLIRCYNSETK